MKVVLFCGGYGMRMRNSSDDMIPKPMQMVGPRPLIWHVMRYYAHFGHTEFILCLLRRVAHQELLPQLRRGRVERLRPAGWSGRPARFRHQRLDHHVRRHRTGIAHRRTTPARTSPPRRRRVLPGQLRRRAHRRPTGHDDRHRCHLRAAASMMLVPPQSSFHCVDVSDAGTVTGITPVSEFRSGRTALLRAHTGGVRPPPVRRRSRADACGGLAAQGRLYGYRHSGFWKPADTFKERADLEAAFHRGDRPWMVWDHPAHTRGRTRGEAACRFAVVIELHTGDLGEIAVLGAHCDDIAIAVGGTLLTLAKTHPTPACTRSSWAGRGTSREQEERSALAAFCGPMPLQVTVGTSPTDGARTLGRREGDRPRVRPLLFPRRRVRTAAARCAPGPPTARRDRPDGVPRPPGAGLRDPEVGG